MPVYEFPSAPPPRSKPSKTYGRTSPSKTPYASARASAPFKSPAKVSGSPPHSALPSSSTATPTGRSASGSSSSNRKPIKSPAGALASSFEQMRTPSTLSSSPSKGPSYPRGELLKKDARYHGSSDFERSFDDDLDEHMMGKSSDRGSDKGGSLDDKGANSQGLGEVEKEEEVEESQPEIVRGGGLKSLPSGLSEPMDIDHDNASLEEGFEIDEIFSETSRRSSVRSSSSVGGGRKRRSPGRQSGSSPKKQATTLNGHAPASSSRSDSRAAAKREEKESDEEEEEEEEEEGEVVIHVEARLHPRPTHFAAVVQSNLRAWLAETFPKTINTNRLVDGWDDIPMLAKNLERVWIAESQPEMAQVDLENARFEVHLYKAAESEEVEEYAGLEADDDDQEKQVPAATVRELPCSSFEGLWDNLIYADDLKARLLNYINSTIAFSEAEVDFNIVSWNRLVLLHGLPGTGKTSLCRGLAQKLSVRLSHIYPCTEIVEINSHSLFSKWFSESGKLVQKLFSSVTEKVNDPGRFVVVMIDEVESLTAARAGAASGTEPSDALRVVNALLTQLDKLKTRKNVLVMTTSNIAGAIDSAFVDRADIKVRVELPPPEAIYWIARGCLAEMQRTAMCGKGEVLEWAELPFAKQRQKKRAALAQSGADGGQVHMSRDEVEELRNTKKRRQDEIALRVEKLSIECHRNSFSGRRLRRLPVLGKVKLSMTSNKIQHTLEEWVKAIEEVVKDEEKDESKIEHSIGRKP